MNIVHQIQRMRANQATNQQIAQHRRQIKASEDDHGEDRGTKQQEDERESAQEGFRDSGILQPS
jgi:hypothetical protein